MSQAGIQPEATGQTEETTSIHDSATGDAEVGQNDSYSTLQDEKPSGSNAGDKEPQEALPRRSSTLKPNIDALLDLESTHLEKMKRFALATAKAMAFSGTSPEAQKNSDAIDKRQYIRLSFGEEPSFVVPWLACHTWNTFEVLLKEWFKDDVTALDNISKDRYILQTVEGVVIHPHVWEYVLQHDWSVQFLLLSPPPPPPESQGVESEQTVETGYESRIQYTVSYFQKNQFSSMNDFISQTTYDEPVEFEVISDFEKLPALEERKEVLSSNASERNHVANGEKPKLSHLDKVGKPQLVIHSLFLLNVLRAVVEFTADPPTGEVDGLTSGVFDYPFKDLYYHIDQLRQYRAGNLSLRAKHSAEFNQSCDRHIDLLVKYLESQQEISITKIEAQWKKAVPAVTFADLWLLLKPGTDVYVRENDGSLSGYVMDLTRVMADSMVASVWHLAFDGTMIIRRSRDIPISVFDNEREITALPLFPAKFQDDYDHGELRKKLEARGRNYFQYSKEPSFLQYTGKGLRRGLKYYKWARVVVDHSSAPWFTDNNDLTEHGPHFNLGHLQVPLGGTARIPSCLCKECNDVNSRQEVYIPLKFEDYNLIDHTSKRELLPHQYWLMPSHMFAFILKDRKYDLVAVDGLEQPTLSETAIDRLVMNQQSKDIIKAIAKTYTFSRESGRFSADFILGKGEGQIILLHGPPGTGKTFTAESVAEYTKRPLLSITAADLGHEPEKLEGSLLSYFRDAHKWDAVVLLDEADVYLEQRSTNDLKRNGIVSVFLRALDYFQGILFLTTNRVGQFDEAFMSRIHLSLGYPKLDHPARSHIWDNLFRKLGEDHESGGTEIRYEYDAKQYVKTNEVNNLEWNGREIRNALQTAVALAVFDSKSKQNQAVPKVTENHLKQVVSMSSAFRQYIIAAHSGMDDSTWAFKRGNREDNFYGSGASNSVTK